MDDQATGNDIGGFRADRRVGVTFALLAVPVTFLAAWTISVQLLTDHASSLVGRGLDTEAILRELRAADRLSYGVLALFTMAMLVPSIGIAFGRKWAFALGAITGAAGVVAFLWVGQPAMKGTQFPFLDFIRVNMVVGVACCLSLATYSVLRLSGKHGPRPS